MPKKADATEPVKVEIVQPEQKPDEVLVPFSVILDGVDRTIFAKDPEDLQVRIAKRRSSI